ncbi:MAG: MBOAT family protein [Lachnospiraceae bacterium]|nr:MBOAT family protein [Lachnospiraceae bacterium]
MLFGTAAFAVFMTAVFLIYWLMPHKFRWIVILAADIWFYICYDVRYLAVMFAVMIASFACAIMMEGREAPAKKKALMTTGVVVTLSLLFVFKYLDFALYSVSKVLSRFAIPMHETTLKIIMPIGISFYSFMAVGYLVDVYRGNTKAVRHFGKYAIFLSFFPNISSGPIERAGHFIPQIDKEKSFDYDSVVYGARLLLLGLVKKAVIADMISKYVDEIYNNVPEHYGICIIWATFLYAFQIYCDFSGYSEMAIGVAKMLGFDLITNFRQPYLAISVKEYWSRWHMSLSGWLKDYLYIPLGGNRCSKVRRDINILITFLISGLWHGASWTFVAWGGFHGIFQIIENRIKEAAGLTKEKEKSLKAGARMLLRTVTFLAVTFAWMFFRANSISESLYLIRHMFDDFSLTGAMAQMSMRPVSVVKTTVAIVLVAVYDILSEKRDMLKEINRLKEPVRWLIYIAAAVLVIVMRTHTAGPQEFIYFKF